METLTRLMRASAIGHINAVEDILEEGEEDVNITGPRGSTALMFAVGGGHLEVVKTLVRKGANIHAMESGGWTALKYAEEDGEQDIIKYLISHGAVH